MQELPNRHRYCARNNRRCNPSRMSLPARASSVCDRYRRFPYEVQALAARRTLGQVDEQFPPFAFCCGADGESCHYIGIWMHGLDHHSSIYLASDEQLGAQIERNLAQTSLQQLSDRELIDSAGS